MSGGEVELETEPGVAVTVDGKKRRSVALESDASGEPTVVEHVKLIRVRTATPFTLVENVKRTHRKKRVIYLGAPRWF